jgi:hypothetical protein
MFSKSFKRLLLIGVTMLALVLVIAPAGFAGEDDGSDDSTTTTEQTAPAPAPEQSSSSSSSSSSGGGSSDTKVAVGGVQTGAGGMASVSEPGVMLPVAIGGTLVLLSAVGAGGLAFRRR